MGVALTDHLGSSRRLGRARPASHEDLRTHTFVVEEWPGLVRLASLLTNHHVDAVDLAQEALIVAIERFDRLDRPGAYATTTLINLCRRWHRTRARQELLGLRRDADLVVANDSPGRELLDVLARLPYRQRAVLVLRYWAGLSEQEIADTIGSRPGTVKTLASRGLASLRKELEDRQ